jgi:hypothetical protein
MRSWDILALTCRIIDITASSSLSLLPLQILCPASIQSERHKPLLHRSASWVFFLWMRTTTLQELAVSTILVPFSV